MSTETKLFDVAKVFPRVAVVDDVFACPSAASLNAELVQFWAEVSNDDDAVAQLQDLCGTAIANASDIDDAALSKIFQNRASLNAIDEHVSHLFLRHDQRLSDVKSIVDLLRGNGFVVETFYSTERLFESKKFSLVFLDLFLDGGNEGESSQIARRIYSEFKAFVFLMSDKPGAADIEENFRSRSRLLKGFFCFCPKSELCDDVKLARRLESLPRDSRVCHQIHEFVLSIDLALGGPLDDPAEFPQIGKPQSSLLYGFIKTLRSLGLSDYAMLCELTLRDEGHPLGDYMIRLLGSYLTQQLLENSDVQSAVVKLDQMRFDEFLPFAGDSSEAMNELYAASITETISNSWGNHPWEPVATLDEQSSGATDE